MDKIHARLILEILGRPAEHVSSALAMLVDKISKEKGVKLLEKHLHDPVEVKDSKDLYTTFTEITIECENLSVFFGIVFAYMPANIEIIQPDEIVLRNEDLTQLSSRIIQRIHDYDAIARRLIVDNQILKQKLGITPQNQQAAAVQNNPTVDTPKTEEVTKSKKNNKKSKRSKKK